MSETYIHPNALVEEGAELGAGVKVGAFSIIKAGAKLDDGVVVHEQVHIAACVSLGRDCEIFPQVVLGQAPQDFKFQGERTDLVIGQRNIIREHVTIHPGTGVGGGMTKVGDDGYFMVGAHIGHDCFIGNHVVLSNAVALGGYVEIGDHANLSGLVGVHQFTRIGQHAFIGALAYVSCDVIPYGMATGNPAHLNGLNVIGMQRSGISRQVIRKTREAYKALFCKNERLFAERLDGLASDFEGSAPVNEIMDFINSRSRRPLCLPHAR